MSDSELIRRVETLARVYNDLVIEPAGRIGAANAAISGYDDTAKELKAAIARIVRQVAVGEVLP